MCSIGSSRDTSVGGNSSAGTLLGAGAIGAPKTGPVGAAASRRTFVGSGTFLGGSGDTGGRVHTPSGPGRANAV